MASLKLEGTGGGGTVSQQPFSSPEREFHTTHLSGTFQEKNAVNVDSCRKQKVHLLGLRVRSSIIKLQIITWKGLGAEICDVSDVGHDAAERGGREWRWHSVRRPLQPSRKRSRLPRSAMSWLGRSRGQGGKKESTNGGEWVGIVGSRFSSPQARLAITF